MTETATKNGKNKNDAMAAAKPAPQPRHGLNRLREEECYYLSGLIKRCLYEAQHLVETVHDTAFDRTTDYDGSKGTKPLNRVEAHAILGEAYECAALALAYIHMASTHLQDDIERDDPYTAQPAF
jgi:hypothetical protein